MRRSVSTALRALLLSVTLLLAPGGLALAGPVQEFEDRIREAYADYRAALFMTNQKSVEASAKALAGFRTKWQALDAALRANPPPHYQGDARLPATLESVAGLIGRADGEIAKGDLPAAHETLEGIRDLLGDLRARNGLIGFSDRMNAYHALMEHVLSRDHGGFGPAAIGVLREDAAVLAWLAGEIERNPAPESSDLAYAPLVAALTASVSALQQAARAGDPAAVKAALGNLKGPYSRLFLKFG
jgi:hypothetical protein